MAKVKCKCGSPSVLSFSFKLKAKAGSPITYSTDVDRKNACAKCMANSLKFLAEEIGFYAEWAETGERPDTENRPSKAEAIEKSVCFDINETVDWLEDLGQACMVGPLPTPTLVKLFSVALESTRSVKELRDAARLVGLPTKEQADVQ